MTNTFSNPYPQYKRGKKYLTKRSGATLPFYFPLFDIKMNDNNYNTFIYRRNFETFYIYFSVYSEETGSNDSITDIKIYLKAINGELKVLLFNRDDFLLSGTTFDIVLCHKRIEDNPDGYAQYSVKAYLAIKSFYTSYKVSVNSTNSKSTNNPSKLYVGDQTNDFAVSEYIFNNFYSRKALTETELNDEISGYTKIVRKPSDKNNSVTYTSGLEVYIPNNNIDTIFTKTINSNDCYIRTLNPTNSEYKQNAEGFVMTIFNTGTMNAYLYKSAESDNRNNSIILPESITSHFKIAPHESIDLIRGIDRWYLKNYRY